MLRKLLPKSNSGKRMLKRWLLEPAIPRHIADRFIRLSDLQLQTIEESLRKNFFSREPPEYLTSNAGRQDLQKHLIDRLENDRKFVIPWLDQVQRLNGARVLEIGCGTGCSTIALAEQGARIVAVDVDELALADARTRCSVYDLKVDFLQAGGQDVGRLLAGEQFDFIIFWACLEHMTHGERLHAMEATYRMLPSGGLWCVLETPNRLWPFDSHTSQLPFFMWLPDDLAMKYSRLSPRERFNEAFPGGSDSDVELRFARWGRGLSFHEFELAIGAVDQLQIVGCKTLFHRNRKLYPRIRSAVSGDRRFESLLRKQCPRIPEAFFLKSLDLLIRKP